MGSRGSNDNRELTRGALAADRDYVDDYMAEACRHFKERGIDRDLVARAMMAKLFKMLDGNPFRSPMDEGAVKGDQRFLWMISDRIEPMVKAWDTGWLRAQREKLPFNRAARRPARPLSPRMDMPVPGEGLLKFTQSMRRLGLFKGFVYTDREIQARHRNRVARAMRLTTEAARQRRCKMLAADRDGILQWYRAHRHLATVRDAG